MQRRQQADLQLFRRKRDFLERTNAPTAYGVNAPQLAELRELTDRLTALAAEQETHVRLARAGTATIRQQMRTLRWDLMRPSELTARRLAPNGVSLGDSFRVAPSIRHPEALLTAALAMAQRAAEHRDTFVATGLPPGFVEVLHAGALALRDAVDARAHTLARRAAVTAELAALVTHGRRVVSLVESMLGTSVEGDRALAAEWKSVVRGRAARRVRSE